MSLIFFELAENLVLLFTLLFQPLLYFFDLFSNIFGYAVFDGLLLRLHLLFIFI